MAELGVNISSRGGPSPAEVASSGAGWVRLVLRADPTQADAIRAYRRAGLRVLGVLARESVEGVAPYAVATAGLLDALQVGNEPDLASPSSWTMEPAEWTWLVDRVSAALANAGVRVPLVGAGLASGNPAWLDGLELSAVSALAIHPYGQDAPDCRAPTGNFGRVGDLIGAYARRGKPLWVTEFGTDTRDEAQAARYIGAMARTLRDDPRVAVAFHFCWSDSMVEPFGLVRRDGSRKPAHEAFRAAAHQQGGTSMATVEERLAQLERQQSLQSEAIAAGLAGHYQDGPQSAKGILVQLNPKFKDLQVVEPAPKA